MREFRKSIRTAVPSALELCARTSDVAAPLNCPTGKGTMLPGTHHERLKMIRLATTLLVGILPLGGLVAATAGPDAANDLVARFTTPPASARPWVYWMWIDGNMTREGITADLEAMQRAGIGGVLIMEVTTGAPAGPVAFGGPAWRELFKHTVAEAGRLGLEVNMNNDAGWCGSGGPWITPEHAMQKIVWTETTAEGPQPFQARLPQPATIAGYYRDIAVLAFPTPPADADPKTRFRIERLKDKVGMARKPIAAPAHFASVPAEVVVAGDRIIDGQDPADDQSIFSGFNNDNSRSTEPGYGPPLQDMPGYTNEGIWGSAHAVGFNMAFCDGSVRG